MSYNTTAWTTDGQTQTTGGATLYKEFGLFDFSPAATYHYPMVSNNMMFSDSGVDLEAIAGFGTDPDPATTLNVAASAYYAQFLPAFAWYIEDNITIDKVRVIGTCNSSESLNFHLYSYDIDTTAAVNYGNLTSGRVVAHIDSVMAATAATVKTDTLTIDKTAIPAGKVNLAFAENISGTGDITAQMVVKYHLT